MQHALWRSVNIAAWINACLSSPPDSGKASPEPSVSNMPDRLQGAVLLGALADAYGYIVEFESAEQIARRRDHGFGFLNPQSWFYEGIGHVASDDTQMTLFTVEACVTALRSDLPLEAALAPACREAYLAWYFSQSGRGFKGSSLATHRKMRFRRAPGGTCLQALAVGGQGTRSLPINNSKGCGGVMRVAPIAFLPEVSAEEVWHLACDSAALTHGNVLGWSAAGALAVLLKKIAEGYDVEEAARMTREFISPRPGGYELAACFSKAIALSGKTVIMTEEIEALGGGWVAEEAVSIGLAAALMKAPIPAMIEAAAHHSGDSDSTASICGQILGASVGLQALEKDPFMADRIQRLDLREPAQAVLSDIAPLL